MIWYLYPSLDELSLIFCPENRKKPNGDRATVHGRNYRKA